MSSVTIGEILSRKKSPQFAHSVWANWIFCVHLSPEKKKGEEVGCRKGENSHISRITGFSMQHCRGILLFQSVPSFSSHYLQRTVTILPLKTCMLNHDLLGESWHLQAAPLQKFFITVHMEVDPLCTAYFKWEMLCSVKRKGRTKWLNSLMFMQQIKGVSGRLHSVWYVCTRLCWGYKFILNWPWSM